MNSRDICQYFTATIARFAYSYDVTLFDCCCLYRYIYLSHCYSIAWSRL